VNVGAEIVKAILDAEDLEGLLRIGAPSDEYDNEARMIAERLSLLGPQPTVEQVAAIVTAVVAQMFGPLSREQLNRRQAVHRRVAQRLLGRVPP
jgi:hypothetical protein